MQRKNTRWSIKLLPALNICHVGTILGDKKPAPLQAHQNFSSGPTKKNVSASSLEAHYFLTCSKHVAKVIQSFTGWSH